MKANTWMNAMCGLLALGLGAVHGAGPSRAAAPDVREGRAWPDDGAFPWPGLPFPGFPFGPPPGMPGFGAFGPGGFAGHRLERAADGRHILIKFGPPGMIVTRAEVVVRGDAITVRGECRPTRGGGSGGFVESFALPRPVVADDVKSELTDGVLTVTLTEIP